MAFAIGCVPAPGVPYWPPVDAGDAVGYQPDQLTCGRDRHRVIDEGAATVPLDLDQIEFPMLPASVRMRDGHDFALAIRRGRKVAAKTVILHAWQSAGDSSSPGPLIGFVVSKAVGSAVTRNRTKRRLRHLTRARLEGMASDVPDSWRHLRLVIRALPAAASHPERLADDLDSAWSRAVRSDWRRNPRRLHKTEAGSA